MQYFLSAKIRLFCGEGEDEEALRDLGLHWLLGMDTKKEKIHVSRKVAAGFNERPIFVYAVRLEKPRHVRRFTEVVRERLGDEKRAVLREMESRLDGNLHFFLRFTKEGVLRQKLVLTDHGSCYHVMLSVAAFPRRRETALNVLRAFFSN